ARLYKQAIDSLQQANSIRESVLAVDPANGECRCQVDTNLRVIGSYYKELGQRDAWLSNLLREVDVRRHHVREHPDNYAWRANLASVLTTLVRALPGEDADPRASSLYREAAEEREKVATYYRDLVAKSNFDRDKFK